MRDVTESVTCDAAGCRKHPGGTHEHVEVAVTYRANPDDVPDGTAVSPVAAHEVLDFCSWEHAVKGLAEYAGEAEKRRDQVLADARAVADERKAYQERIDAIEKARVEAAARAEGTSKPKAGANA